MLAKRSRSAPLLRRGSNLLEEVDTSEDDHDEDMLPLASAQKDPMLGQTFEIGHIMGLTNSPTKATIDEQQKPSKPVSRESSFTALEERPKRDRSVSEKIQASGAVKVRDAWRHKPTSPIRTTSTSQHLRPPSPSGKSISEDELRRSRTDVKPLIPPLSTLAPSTPIQDLSTSESVQPRPASKDKVEGETVASPNERATVTLNETTTASQESTTTTAVSVKEEVVAKAPRKWTDPIEEVSSPTAPATPVRDTTGGHGVVATTPSPFSMDPQREPKGKEKIEHWRRKFISKVGPHHGVKVVLPSHVEDSEQDSGGTDIPRRRSFSEIAHEESNASIQKVLPECTVNSQVSH
jgi:hypothetical protein